VSELLREKRGLSAEMATRLALLLDTTPESWPRMQEAIDLWEVRQTPDRFKDIKQIEEGWLNV
jgi:antitoxin HigA-1